MFCMNCGTQAPDGASFCPKCGAQLSPFDQPQNSPPPMAPDPASLTGPAPAGGSGKKLVLIIAAVALALAVLAAAVFVLLRGGDKDSGRAPDKSDDVPGDISDDVPNDGSDGRLTERDDADSDEPGSDESEPISLTQTFHNTSEGFSFRCPGDWALENGNGADSDAIMSVACTGDLGIYGRLTVSKIPNDGSLDSATADDFKTGYLSDPGISEVGSVKLREARLDGREAKKITLTFKNDVEASCAGVQYYYAAGLDIYIVTGVYLAEYSDKYEPILDAIMDSYTITAPEPDPGALELAAAKAAYADVVRELASETEGLTFDLIDLTGSDVPELLAGMDGYYVSVYMWANGEAVPVIEYWPYGAMGNAGYEYLPGQNIIRNFNSDLAGAIVYETYMTIDGDYGVIPIWSESLSSWYFLDQNGNYMIDEDEPILDEPMRYYGGTAITQEQYAGYQFPGDYQWMIGSKSADEILELLGARRL